MPMEVRKGCYIPEVGVRSIVNHLIWVIGTTLRSFGRAEMLLPTELSLAQV